MPVDYGVGYPRGGVSYCIAATMLPSGSSKRIRTPTVGIGARFMVMRPPLASTARATASRSSTAMVQSKQFGPPSRPGHLAFVHQTLDSGTAHRRRCGSSRNPAVPTARSASRTRLRRSGGSAGRRRHGWRSWQDCSAWRRSLIRWPELAQSRYSVNRCRESATRRTTSRFSWCARLATEFADGAALAAHAHPWGQLIYASAGVMTRVDRTGHRGSRRRTGRCGRRPASPTRCGSRATASLRTLYLRPGHSTRLPATSAVDHGLAAAARADRARRRDRHARSARARRTWR